LLLNTIQIRRLTDDVELPVEHAYTGSGDGGSDRGTILPRACLSIKHLHGCQQVLSGHRQVVVIVMYIVVPIVIGAMVVAVVDVEPIVVVAVVVIVVVGNVGGIVAVAPNDALPAHYVQLAPQRRSTSESPRRPHGLSTL
jgi:hypothetical protein